MIAATEMGFGNAAEASQLASVWRNPRHGIKNADTLLSRSWPP